MAIWCVLLGYAQAAFPSSPEVSLLNMSDDTNEFSDTGKIGIIVGYAVFALFYVIAVIAIFIDICKDYNKYSELVEGDLKEMRDLGMEAKFPEFEEELKLRL